MHEKLTMADLDGIALTDEQHQFQACPYCRERIRADAIKCRYCQAMLGVTPSESTNKQLGSGRRVLLIGFFIFCGLIFIAAISGPVRRAGQAAEQLSVALDQSSRELNQTSSIAAVRVKSMKAGFDNLCTDTITRNCHFMSGVAVLRNDGASSVDASLKIIGYDASGNPLATNTWTERSVAVGDHVISLDHRLEWVAGVANFTLTVTGTR